MPPLVLRFLVRCCVPRQRQMPRHLRLKTTESLLEDGTRKRAVRSITPGAICLRRIPLSNLRSTCRNRYTSQQAFIQNARLAVTPSPNCYTRQIAEDSACTRTLRRQYDRFGCRHTNMACRQEAGRAFRNSWAEHLLYNYCCCYRCWCWYK